MKFSAAGETLNYGGESIKFYEALNYDERSIKFTNQ